MSVRAGAAGALQIAGVVLSLSLLLTSGVRESTRRREPDRRLRSGAAVRLEVGDLGAAVHLGSGRILVRRRGDPVEHALALAAVLDGRDVPLVFERASVETPLPDRLRARIPVDASGDRMTLELAVRIDDEAGVVRVALTLEVPPSRARPSPGGRSELRPHTVALRLATAMEAHPAFVPGVGEVADLARVAGPAAILDADFSSLGVIAPAGVLSIDTAFSSVDADGRVQLRLDATSGEAMAVPGGEGRVELALALSPLAPLYDVIGAVRGESLYDVRGVVRGASSRAQVVGFDEEGRPRVRIATDAAGAFAVRAPIDVVEWYATTDGGGSEPRHHVPGAPDELRLDVAPVGELHVRVIDVDTREPLTARVIVRGRDGTPDPSFGPDYRASGAGPLVDALRGELSTPLPRGKYKVLATRGLEYTIDAREVEIGSGDAVWAELGLRRAVATPRHIACDLHVHARPSFDTPVTAEDRVLSLVAAGIEFAVPSEHNVVGDYGLPLEAQGLEHELAWVHGVEVTTFAPRFGHFGVFPYPPGPPPPFRGTNADELFRAAREGDDARVLQVNHPRLPLDVGYFSVAGFDPARGIVPKGMRTDFDTIEVYNGYEIGAPEKTQAVLRDWYALLNRGYRFGATGSSDSHTVQYHWAGYPRTMAEVPEGRDAPADVDKLGVVAAIRQGRAFVTSGPVVELAIEGVAPGGELVTTADRVEAHVHVSAAPWVDVSAIDIVVGGRVAKTVAVASRPTRVGAEPGTPMEVFARATRYDDRVEVPLPATKSTWLHVVVRGTRTLDDVLPFMPVRPLAFTNPVFLVRSAERRDTTASPPTPSP
jgi:hypothetical protein